MNKTRGLLLAVAVVAMAFTFSCSSDGGSSGATYWYSVYRLDESKYNYIRDLLNQYENPSYDDIKNVYVEIRSIGTFVESYNGVSEQEIKDFSMQSGVAPKEADDYLSKLKKRGNIMAAFGTDPPPYYLYYVERE